LVVFSQLQSSTGKIWLGTSRGLAAWIPDARNLDREFEFYDLNNGLIGRYPRVLTEDRDGNLWIGTEGEGVMRMAPNGLVSYYAEDGLAGRTDIGSIFETRQGELCFLEQAVVSRFDGRRFVRTRVKFPSDIRYYGWGTGRLALQDHTGDWWIATGQGLVRFPPVSLDKLASVFPKAIYRTAEGLPGGDIFQIFEDSRGDVWIGIMDGPHGGTARWERSTGRIRTVEVDTPTGFTEDRAGNIWIGSYHNVLARYNGVRVTFFTDSKGVSRGGWKVPFIDSAGRLWVADERGLTRADNPTDTTPTFVTYTDAQGLASSDVKAITQDLYGNLYVATGRGVDRVQPTAEGISVTKHYTNADGLAAGELASAYRDRSGTLWFVTTLGISRLIPSLDRPPVLPPVLVTGLLIGIAPQPLADVGQAEVQGLRIRPGQGPLRIDFVGLSFASGETLRYQYQLSGVDRDWSDPTDQRTVVYGRLAAGKYHFLVRAVNNQGMTSPVPAGVVFTMLPPVWLSWWFLSTAVLTAAALMYAAHRYRVRHLLAVERVRTRIAADLHDDIGASLSQIAVLSEMARRTIKGADSRAVGPLAEIASMCGELVDAMSDIVWAINPKHDRLSNLEHRMRRFAGDVLSARGIDLEFQAGIGQDDLRVGADLRRQVFLIFKEAVNNIARHSGCSRARVEFKVVEDDLVLQVTDRGKGFDLSARAEGNGLMNIQKRTADLGGTVMFESAPSQGTTLRLRIPLAHQYWWGRARRR
jgi:signal transduction histidine kinase/streptogramin lyase